MKTTQTITGGSFLDLRRRVDQMLREMGLDAEVGDIGLAPRADLHEALRELVGLPRAPRSAGGMIDVHAEPRPLAGARLIASHP